MLRILGLIGVVLAAISLAAQVRAGNVRGWKLALFVIAISMWLVGLTLSYLHV